MKESCGVVYCDSHKYRYRMWRRWQPLQPSVCMILHNPTSNEGGNDPTIDRCAILADRWGFGGIEFVNLFAYCATKPQELWRADDPVGPHNDQHIRRAVAHSRTCVIAWGDVPASRVERTRQVLKLLEGRRLYCLGVTKRRQPRHPLYLVNFADTDAEIKLLPFPSSPDLLHG